MTKSKQKKQKAALAALASQMRNVSVRPKPKQKKTPFADTGGIVGKRVGQFLGYPQLQGVGRWLGSGIGAIFGSGDYVATTPAPSYNVFSGQIPKFSSTRATNIVCHREYLGDIGGSTAFVNTAFPLNPGMDKTFPWLSNIATCYQQYKFHGLVFEFRPLITDFVTGGAPGTLCMATNYNADSGPFVSRQDAQNSEFAVSTKPTQALVHMIECAPDQTANKMYNIRSGSPASGQDLRTYDYGTTQIMTQNNPAGSMGELWVSYCVEFFKPIPSRLNSFVEGTTVHVQRSGVSSGAPLGTTTTSISGNLKDGTAVTGNNTLTVSDLDVGVAYQFSIYGFAPGGTITMNVSGSTGCAAYNVFNGNTTNIASSGGGAVSVFTIVAKATSTIASITMTATVSGTATCDCFVSVFDPTLQ